MIKTSQQKFFEKKKNTLSVSKVLLMKVFIVDFSTFH